MQSQSKATNTDCAIVCSSDIALRVNNNYATIYIWRGAIHFTPKPLHRRNRLGKNSYQDIYISKYIPKMMYIFISITVNSSHKHKLKRTTAATRRLAPTIYDDHWRLSSDIRIAILYNDYHTNTADQAGPVAQ